MIATEEGEMRKKRKNVKGWIWCDMCGKRCQPTSNRQKYCPQCALKAARQRNREYIMRLRAGRVFDES
jgi:Zn finger protein HypA/HybF involved in hydrogenase expression